MGSLAKVEKSKGLQGRRFTKEQRAKALDLLASGMGPSDVAKIIGTTTQSLTRWKPAAGKHHGWLPHVMQDVPHCNVW